MVSEPNRQEQPSTYFVADRSKKEELRRLEIQDQLLTRGMGGVLPEQPHPEHIQRILDVGCGTGGWLIELTKNLPASQCIGVDVSKTFVKYARARAEEQGVSERVEFLVMDALRMLEFPNAFFDLINQRLAISYLRTWDWPKLLSEYRRLLRMGGIIRIVEPEVVPTTSSKALTDLFTLLRDAFYQSGHLFVRASDGLTNQLSDLLERFSFSHLETRVSTMVYHSNTDEAHKEFEDVALLFRTVLPFLSTWTRVPETYDELYQQALDDMRQPDFFLRSQIMTVWGTKN